MQAYKELYDTGNDIAQEEIATADAHLPLMESDWPKGDLHLGQVTYAYVIGVLQCKRCLRNTLNTQPTRNSVKYTL